MNHPRLWNGSDTEYVLFEELKWRLVSPSVLRLPRYGLKYMPDTAACGNQVGCALVQAQPERGTRPIGCWSRALTDAERNYKLPKINAWQ